MRGRRPQSLYRRRLTRRVLTVSVLLILLAAGLILFVRADRWRLNEIKIVGAETVSEGEVRMAIENQLIGDKWFFLPRRSIWSYPRHELAEFLLAAFPRLATVRIRNTAPQTLTIELTERRGVVVWCTGNEAEADGCYLVDDTGLLIAAAPQFSGQVFFILTGLLPAEPLGYRPLFPEVFTALLNFRDELAKLIRQYAGSSWTIERVNLTASGDDVFVGRGFKILFDHRAPLEAALQSAAAALASSALAASTTELEYLDLRLPAKVFYKFRQ